MDAAQEGFVAALPKMERTWRWTFRDWSADWREEGTQEARGLGWQHWLRAIEQGKDPAKFATAIARFSGLQVRCGRKLAGGLKSREAFNGWRNGTYPTHMEYLPVRESRWSPSLAVALVEHREGNPADVGAFRLDFRAWLARKGGKAYRLVLEAIAGTVGKDIAAILGISEGRVSQMRRELRSDWEEYTGDPLEQVG